jgi:hypothetical protein
VHGAVVGCTAGLLAAELQSIKRVIVVHYRDCGAPRIACGAEKVATPKAAPLEFRKQLPEKQPMMGVQLGLMALDGKLEIFS